MSLPCPIIKKKKWGMHVAVSHAYPVSSKCSTRTQQWQGKQTVVFVLSKMKHICKQS